MRVSILVALFLLVIGGIFVFQRNVTQKLVKPVPTPGAAKTLDPMSIEVLRNRSFPGSEIKIEETLADGSNYHQYLTSYQSDGLKIYALLTVPSDTKPRDGWPVILFNHGYIAPEVYRTTERYVAYVDAFASRGYIVFKLDYRGNGLSEGIPEGAYYSPAYTIDDLNALSSIKKYRDANANKIGVWGHSMGGNIALRDLVVVKDIKAAVIWGGVVGSYDDLMNNWQRRVSYRPSTRELALRNNKRQNLVAKYGTPKANPDFWNQIDPTAFVKDIQTPVQLHSGGLDEEVPPAFSIALEKKLKSAGKTVEYFEYPGSDHNITQGFNLAMERSVGFFDKYLK